VPAVLSIVVPTYNERDRLPELVRAVFDAYRAAGVDGELVIVDDNSPDGTGDIASQHGKSISNGKLSIQVVRRQAKLGLSSAILAGVQSSSGDIVVVMDGDFSHPPQTIPHMVEEIQNSKYDIVVASRYIKGGSIAGWPFKRRLMSKGATKIAKYGLGIQVQDPMSGFFAFRRHIIEGVKFDAIGYKMLLEILVKTKGAKVKEVPYTFTNRRDGTSKLDTCVMLDYFRAVWKLYRYGKSLREKERRASVRFFSKAGRFYTVGASGLLVNFVVSFLFQAIVPELWYLYTTIIGIFFSMTSNFLLNKVWTFEDRDFAAKKSALQYAMFMGFSSLGALIQLGVVYGLVENYHVSYPIALVLAVMAASLGNFVFNKKWTFKEKIWS